MKLKLDIAGKYNPEMSAWCVWMLSVGKYKIGLQCNHKHWMRLHGQVWTKTVCSPRTLLRIDCDL